MPPSETSNLPEMSAPTWLLVAVLVCLPVSLAVFWRLGRRWIDLEPLPPPPPPREGPGLAVPWPLLVGIILFVGLQVLMPLTVAGYDAAAEAGWLPWEPLGVDLIFSPGMILGQVAPLVVGLAIVRMFGRGAVAAVGVRAGQWRWGLLVGLVGFAAILPVCFGILMLTSLLAGVLEIEERLHPLLLPILEAPRGWMLPVGLVEAAVLAPLAEEFLYRGILLRSLLKRVGTTSALLLSSALFAGVHYTVEPQATPSLFVLGMALAYTAYRTRSLVAPVVIHALFNGLMVVSLFSAGR